MKRGGPRATRISITSLTFPAVEINGTSTRQAAEPGKVPNPAATPYLDSKKSTPSTNSRWLKCGGNTYGWSKQKDYLEDGPRTLHKECHRSQYRDKEKMPLPEPTSSCKNNRSHKGETVLFMRVFHSWTDRDAPPVPPTQRKRPPPTRPQAGHTVQHPQALGGTWRGQQDPGSGKVASFSRGCSVTPACTQRAQNPWGLITRPNVPLL